MATTDEMIREVTELALIEFWNSVMDSCKEVGLEVRAGDLSPGTSFNLDTWAKAAVREWIQSNCVRK